MMMKDFGRLMRGRTVEAVEEFEGPIKKYRIYLEPVEMDLNRAVVIYSDREYEVSLSEGRRGGFELFDGQKKIRTFERHRTLEAAEARIKELFKQPSKMTVKFKEPK